MIKEKKHEIDVPNIQHSFWINSTNIVIDDKYENIIYNIINTALCKDVLINIDRNNPWYKWIIHKLEDVDYVKLAINLYKDDKKIIIEFQRYTGDRYLFYDIVQLIARELINFDITNLKVINKINNNKIYTDFNISTTSYIKKNQVQDLPNKEINREELNNLINKDLACLKNDLLNNNYTDSTSNMIIFIIYIMDSIIQNNLTLDEENKVVIDNYIHKSIDYYEKYNYVPSLRFIIVLIIKYKIIDIYRFNTIIDKYKFLFNNYLNDDKLETCTKKNIQKILK